MAFPGEPIGMEDAIGWHLRQTDHHDHNESMADAMDMPESAKWHEARRREHSTRLADLRERFPETARVALEDYESECNAMSEAA